MKNKKIGLLITFSIIVSLLVPSLRGAVIHFGVIRAIEEKIDKLREKKDPYRNLPDISTFRSQKSDRFIADIGDIARGHPYKGRRANLPHQGAHIHFDSTQWPKGGGDPDNYPAIYACVDGVVSKLDYSFRYGDKNQYYIDIAFARDSAGSVYYLHHSIEPMIAEPSENFYRQFVLVSLGQEVRKGDVMAYMYTPLVAGSACHICFHIKRIDKEGFMAPALFTLPVVQGYHDRWSGDGFDGADDIPPCMGYKLEADENPFGTGAVDILW